MFSLLILLLATSQPASINVKDFGAIPDDGKDDSAAIQSAINMAAPGQAIFFPPGVYNITNTVNPRNGTILQGSTKLIWRGDKISAESETILKSADDKFAFHFGGKDFAVRQISFDGRAVFCDLPNNQMVEGLMVDNCWFHLNVEGESANAIEFTTGLRDSQITNCVFDPIHGDNGIYGYNWDGLTIANNQFLNGNEGIHVTAHLDASKNLLIEQNYFAGLHRMAVEVQGGGVKTVVQDNFYEKPAMENEFDKNRDSFAYSIVSDRSRETLVQRNTSLAPERPDGTGVRIIFELGGQGVVCKDNYSVAGNHVIAADGTDATGIAANNRISGYLEGPSNANGSQVKFMNNGPDVQLSWDINRAKPGPNQRLK